MLTTEDAIKMIEKINKGEEKETKVEPEKKEPITPEDKAKPEVKEPVTPTETPEKKDGGVDNSDDKDEKGTDKPDESKKEEVSVESNDKVDTVAKDSSKQEKPEKKYSPEQYTIIKERTKRKEQKAKYEKRIKELEDELNKYKDLKLEHFKDKEGNPDQSSYLDWKFRERDMKDELNSLKAQEEQNEAQYIEQENIRRVNLSFPDEAEKKEYMSLLESKGQSFLDALNEADPNGVVLGYLSTQEKYPIVMKRLMTDMDSLRKVFRSHDPDILKYNIAQFCDEVLTQVPKSTPSVEPSKTEPPKKEIPIIGKQMTSTQTTEPVVKDRNYWNSYLTKHPRG